MKIALTGSSGFIGKNLNKHLFYNNWSVKSISRENLSSKYLTLPDEIDVVIHLAGKTHDQKEISNSDEYYRVNTDLTKVIFDAFLDSGAKVFITLSSVKAVADEVQGVLTEENLPNPITHYGKSKLLAEKYVLSKGIPEGKRVYILRPCMIHGPGNKGNLNLLYKIASKGIPWPLGSFENRRSFCSLENLLFVLMELMERKDIPSGIYNVADDFPLSTNEVFSILAESQNRKPIIWNISKGLIKFIAKFGNVLKLPLNEERLQKLTDSYIVSNKKIITAFGKKFPVYSKEGLMKTFQSFQN